MTRANGVTVYILNRDKLAERYNAANGTDINGGAFLSSGVIINMAGETRTINTEGVTDTGQVKNAQGEWISGDSYAVYTWSGYLEFTLETLQDCLTNETVDLSQYIRTFGDRLERNFSLAFNWATS